MLNRALPMAIAMAIVATTSGAFASAPARTLEDVRYSSELMKCGSLADGERQPCENGVRARIAAEWKARIEAEARRPNHK